MRKVLIGCGLLLLVLACVGGLALGGLLVLGYQLFPPLQPDLQPVVAVAPVGEEVEAKLTFYNPASVDDTLYSLTLHLPAEVRFSRGTPAPRQVQTTWREVILTYDLPLPAGSTQELHLFLRGEQPGQFVVQVEAQTESDTYTLTWETRFSAVESSAPTPDKAQPAPTEVATATPMVITEEPIRDVQQLYRAVVEIVAWAKKGVRLEPVWSGSGTIIAPQGLILTNAHVALPLEKGERVDQLQVWITEAEDRPPVPRYLAEVVQADTRLDLAVIRIVADIDGHPIDPNALHLPFVALGDSDQLHLGDPLTVLGYPGIGGNTITLTKGEVSGFTAESGYGERAWIKTSATIAGGNSGGLAANAQAELVGIPTQLGAGAREEEVVDCRQLADTNGDGIIDERDTCVPIGGFINALRPVNLAKPLIQAALGGQPLVWATPTAPVSQTATPTPAPAQKDQGQEEILFRDDFSDPHSGWPEMHDRGGEIAYRDGGYLLQLNQQQSVLWAETQRFANLKDVVIKVDAIIDSSTGDGEFGLICRYHDDGGIASYYMLTITEDGYAAIWRAQGNDWEAVVDWVRIPWSLRGKHIYTLTASCVGNTLSLSVNGQEVARGRDNALTQGDVGVVIATGDTAGFGILFDNFVLRRP